MGKTADKATRQAEELTAAALSEPVLVVAYANRCGVMGNIVSRTLLNVASDVVLGDQSGPGPGPVANDEIHTDGANVKVPLAFLFAVTPSKIHIFDIKMFMGNLKLKKEIAALDRAGLELASQEDTLVITYRMVNPQQRQEMMFEIMKSDYARDFAAFVRSV